MPSLAPTAPFDLLPRQRPAWARLEALSPCAHPASLPHLRELLTDPQRPARMTVAAAGITLDYSRQRMTPPVFDALLSLARQSHLEAQRDAMLRGERINLTEGRAVLHVALRGAAADAAPEDAPWPASVSDQVQGQLARMLAFADAVRAGQVQGWGNAAITDVVTLGIGGSDLGPRMAVQALAGWADAHGWPTSGSAPEPVRLHFVSNPDAAALYECLKPLDPRRTLFIVSSKTFTTQETLLNAASARRWLLDAGCPAQRLSEHLVAITASPQRAQAAGFAAERSFEFWDWVGGRYSLWSTIGLPVVVAIGSQGFRQLLAGAQAMDRHFQTAPLNSNLPVLLALIGVWNRNFLKAPSHLMVSYAARLGLLPAYVQQMDMESNGKQTHTDGRPVTVDTGPIVWGGLGIDGQHAYYQLVHQGRHRMALDFIGLRHDDTPLPDAPEHLKLVQASLLAQARALSLGRDETTTRAELIDSGLNDGEANRLAPHRSFAGNVPSNLLWLDSLTPATLGALVALYEHKVFCQAAIWNTAAFDQWGVELGKKAVGEVLPALAGDDLAAAPSAGSAALASLDPATRASVLSLR